MFDEASELALFSELSLILTDEPMIAASTAGRHLLDVVSRQLRFSLSTELLPDADNRVTLSQLTDRDGLPRPR
ncbi:hypothetical protein AB4Y38_43415, partial [Paraburkholderia sp. EG285A]|uniref:hypothetical protein n=1 Tax=Paraburkholderia sp. EG285A TaxID=3237009 RepID=UPI0034D34E45